MKTYLLVVRREARTTVPENWGDLVRHLEGVEVEEEDARLGMLRIRATDEAITHVRDELGEWLHVEEPDERQPRQ